MMCELSPNLDGFRLVAADAVVESLQSAGRSRPLNLTSGSIPTPGIYRTFDIPAITNGLHGYRFVPLSSTLMIKEDSFLAGPLSGQCFPARDCPDRTMARSKASVRNTVAQKERVNTQQVPVASAGHDHPTVSC